MKHQTIRELTIEPVKVDELPYNQHPSLYTPVSFQFHWKPTDSLSQRPQEEIDADHKELGRQLMKAIWEERKKHD